MWYSAECGQVQDELGMYTKEAEECFRCIAGVEAKSPCPEVYF